MTEKKKPDVLSMGEVQEEAARIATKLEDIAVKIELLREEAGSEEILSGPKGATDGTTAADFPLSASLLSLRHGIDLLHKTATATEESIAEEWRRRKTLSAKNGGPGNSDDAAK